MMYESCINYVLENTMDTSIYDITDSENKKPLNEIQKDIISTLYYYTDKKLLRPCCLKPKSSPLCLKNYHGLELILKT